MIEGNAGNLRNFGKITNYFDSCYDNDKTDKI